MNTGLFPGVVSVDPWRSYLPRLVTAGSGGETQPVTVSTNGRNGIFGRYLIVDRQVVIAQLQIAWIGAFSVGSGSAYCIELPFPANRWTGQGRSAPLPIGAGEAYISFDSPHDSFVPLIPTLADPHVSLGGDEDRYMQAYCPYVLDWGSFAWSGAASATVNHRVGFAFRPEDLQLCATASAGNAWFPPYVDTITSTQFTVHSRGGATNPAADPGFNYKIRAEPPSGSTGALWSPTAPFDWTRCTTLGPFGNMFFQLAYQAKL